MVPTNEPLWVVTTHGPFEVANGRNNTLSATFYSTGRKAPPQYNFTNRNVEKRLTWLRLGMRATGANAFTAAMQESAIIDTESFMVVRLRSIQGVRRSMTVEFFPFLPISPDLRRREA